MSGLPIDFIGGAGNLYFGPFGGNGRPNLVPGVSPTSNIPSGYYFNPIAFRRPVVLAGQVIPSSGGWAVAGANCGNSVVCTDFGNVGRNILRGPQQFNMDFSISKRFRIDETKNIEFRAEFFNLFNTVNYANPISNLNFATTDDNTGRVINAGDFGRIISTSNNPRLIQLAAKFSF